MNTIGLTAIYVGFGRILVLVLPASEYDMRTEPNNGHLRRVKETAGAAFAFIGRYSYAIYLWHAPVASGGMKAVQRIAGDRLSPVASLAAYVLLSIAIGVVMTKAVETPALKLRERLLPSRAAAV